MRVTVNVFPHIPAALVVVLTRVIGSDAPVQNSTADGAVNIKGSPHSMVLSVTQLIIGGGDTTLTTCVTVIWLPHVSVALHTRVATNELPQPVFVAVLTTRTVPPGDTQFPASTGGSKFHAALHWTVLFEAAMNGTPFCTTLYGSPAMVSTPLRGLALGLCATRYRTICGPVLVAGVSTVIQVFVSVAVHTHKVGDVTDTSPVESI